MTTPSQPDTATPSLAGRFALIGVLLMVDSLHFVFARLLLPHVGPPLSVLYVLGFGTLEVGLFALVTRRLQWSIALRHWRLFTAIGIFVSLSTIFNYNAVAFIDAGTAAMLGKTTIIFGLGFGLFWLGDRLSRLQIVGSGIAILGLLAITYAPGDIFSLGAVLVLGSTFLYAFHAALTKRYAQEMDLTNFFFFRLFFTTAVLVVIVLATGEMGPPPSGRAWIYLLLTGTIDVALSRSLYYLTLRRFKMSVFSIVLTASPVAAIVWSLFLFGTFPSPRELAGGILVLLGVALVTSAPLVEKLLQRRRLAQKHS